MTRQERRKAMPQCAEWMDDTREHFPNSRVLHARENGHEWGEEQPSGVLLSEMERTDAGGWFK